MPTPSAAAAQQVIDKLEQIEAAEAQAPVPTAPLPDVHVTLPGGFPTPSGVVRDAEVRELNGEDEEFIAKATTGSGSNGKMLSAILQRGVVSVGDQKADKDLLDGLLAGDRDALLLAIRRVTFGDDVPYTRVVCPHCRAELEVILSIKDDVPVRELGDNPRVIVLDDLRIGTATVVLPTGSVQRALLEASDTATTAELKTIWLRGCVNAINGMPVVSDSQVQRLGIKDRERILKVIEDANPGPRLSEVKVACPYCEKEMDLPLDLVSLFRF